MESLLALLGLLFFMFLVLAAAVEVILEVFRGTIERFGVTWAKSKVSLDEALKLASEFAPDNTDLNTKLEAVKSVTEQFKDKATDKIANLEALKIELGSSESDLNVIAGELNAIAASIKGELEKSERQRVFLMRLLAAIIGCFLAWQSDFYIFKILAQSPDVKDWMGALKGLQAEWVNVLVGGLAAAAGSSYWHDQLDKVRNIKATAQAMKK